MIKLAFTFAIATFLWATSCSSPAKSPPSEPPAPVLPVSIEQFRAKIAAMNAEGVLAAATAHFGKPTRDMGSGLSIPQWDIEEGVLTVHPIVGPTFVTARRKVVWLISTSNPVRENLLQNFEMTTVPDPANHGTRVWIGNVQIAPDETYRYTDSNSNLGNRRDASKNFFINHPQGRVQMTWPAGVSAESLLESLGDRPIAHLRFIADDGKTGYEGDVMTSADSRRLSITGPTFEMEASWLHFWPKHASRDKVKE